MTIIQTQLSLSRSRQCRLSGPRKFPNHIEWHQTRKSLFLLDIPLLNQGHLFEIQKIDVQLAVRYIFCSPIYKEWEHFR